MKYTIRKGSPEDIKGIMEVERTSFHADIIEKEAVFLERLKVYTEGFFILTEDDRIIGYACTEIWKKKDTVEGYDFLLGHSISKVHDLTGTELYIASMGILPEVRGKGLGEFLFQSMMGQSKEALPHLEGAILIVAESWKKARRIYGAEGFNEVGVLKDFFAIEGQSKEAAIIMTKTL
mgnify:CR=1 FL=1